MVLEALISPMEAEKRPWQMFFLGMIYSVISAALAYKIFESQASYFMVFFTVMACMPIIYNTIKLEESKDERLDSEKTLLKEHAKALSVFIWLFVGITVSFSILYIVLPETVTVSLFSSQSEAIFAINGNISSNGIFSKIIFNNLQVLFYCLLFSFIYGLGAMFILVWNASVLAVAIGSFVNAGIAKALLAAGSVKIATYLQVYSCAYFVRYLPHGLIEIAAYFIAGLAGGILYIAIIRHRIGNKRFMNIIFDSSDLILIAIGLVFIGAIVEVYMTPFLVSVLC